MERVEIELDGRTISLEAGDLARQAGGSVVIRQGDTMVLVAATMAPKPREGIDFFPPHCRLQGKNLCCWENSRRILKKRS